MLNSLSIRNFILIDAIDLDFSSGFTVITGETGAGKSILIDALLSVLGERVQGDLLKKGSDKGYIEAVFSINSLPHINTLLESEHYEAANELIIRREFNSKGTNRCFLNDSPATASFVRTIGNELIDFHGQHEHQRLLRTDVHIDFLDSYAKLQNDKIAYALLWDDAKLELTKLTELINHKDDLQQQREAHAFLLQEIEDIHPLKDELEHIESNITKLHHSVQILEASQSVNHMLNDSEMSARDLVSRTKVIIEQLAKYDSSFQDIIIECNSAIASIDEILSSVQDYSDSLDHSTTDLNQLQERASKLLWLKKKYGSMDNVFESWELYKDKIRITDNVDEEISRLTTTVSKAFSALGKSANQLSLKRKQAAKKLIPQVCELLQTMGISKPVFTISIEPMALSNGLLFDTIIASIDDNHYIAHRNGIDKVEFSISTNPGEEPKPLVKVASGGEISRIMLALKSIIADKDSIPTLIFDEIDTGISGKVSRQVGLAIKHLGNHRQIIAISHSPQIASLANTHINVAKTTVKNSTNISAHTLEYEERIQEIASLLSGTSTTISTVESAKELIEAKDLHI